MDSFFTYLKKGLVATMAVLFTFVFTYVPIPYTNNVDRTEAAITCTNCVNESTDLLRAGKSYAEEATSALYNTMSGLANKYSLWIDEFGNGLAWAAAKALLSNLVKDLTRWVQSGFEGKPMFVSDMKGWLVDVADKEFGAFIEEQAGVGSFLCSPFKLDILIALNLSFARSIDGAPSCTLTDVVDNVEGFTSGVRGSFAEGGWNDWIDLTTSPTTNTLYGQFLDAEAEMFARVDEAEAELTAELDRGEGFRSLKECEDVDQPDGTTKEVCKVTTPGKMISNSISSNLDSSREVLVTADEINELIGSLIEQVAIKTFTGARGFLGS